MIWMTVFTVALSKTRGIIGTGTTPIEQFWVVKKMDQGSISEVGEQAENGDEELGPQRGAMLAVWKFLGFKNPDIDQMSIFCKCCWAKFVGAGSNMSNLIHHISRKHVFEYQECRSASSTSAGNVGSGTTKEKMSRMSLKDTFARGTDERNKWWMDIINAISIHLAKDMVPLCTVQDDAFKWMIKTLDPRCFTQSKIFQPFHLFSNPFWWCIEPKRQESCQCPITYGLGCTSTTWSKVHMNASWLAFAS